jgi:serine protease Do
MRSNSIYSRSGLLTVAMFLISPVALSIASRPALAKSIDRITTPSFSQQAQLAKPAVVRIENGCYAKLQSKRTGKVYSAIAGGFGTGYFVTDQGVLISNEHVVRLSRNLKECEVALLQNGIQQMAAAGEIDLDEIAADPDARVPQVLAGLKFAQETAPLQTVVMGNGDRLPYEIIKTDAQEDVAVLKVEIENAPTLKFGNADQVRPVDPILTIGFPGVVDSQPNQGGDAPVLDLRSNLQPTFSRGEISSFKSISTGAEVFQISAVVTTGSSGSPVMNDRQEVIGMVSFGPNQPGFAFAVTAKSILKVMRQAGVTSTESRTNQLYAEGLTLFDQGQCGAALSKFLKVQALFPYHQEAESRIRQCKQIIQKNQ